MSMRRKEWRAFIFFAHNSWKFSSNIFRYLSGIYQNFIFNENYIGNDFIFLIELEFKQKEIKHPKLLDTGQETFF